jgi:very-short-patch-repair endonuclease
MKRQFFNYNPELRSRARELRKNGTLGEALLWKQLRARQVGFQFHRQVPIGKYIVDLYCKELKVAIEIDGMSHLHEETFAYDERRQSELEQMGVTVLRFQEREVREQIAGVVEAIKEFLVKKSRG